MTNTKDDEDGKRFEFRTGVGALLEGWRGMKRDGDPESVLPPWVRMAVNATLRNGEFEARGGQEKLNSVQFSGCIRLIYDHQCTPNHRLYGVTAGCPQISPGTGFSIFHYDQEQSPAFQRMLYYDGATTNAVLGVFDSAIWVGVDNALKEIVLIRVRYGQENIVLSGVTQDRPTKTFSGFVIRALEEFDGKFFIALDGGAGASKTVVFDGISFQDDTAATTQIVTGFGLYRDWIIAGYSSAVGKISYRPAGDAMTAWTDVALANCGQVGHGVSYKDKYYVANGSTQVFQLDGTTLTSSTTIAGAAITDLAVAYGYLYAFYTNGVNARIARYDGTTWTAIHKDLTAQVATLTGCKKGIFYRGDLYVYVSTAASNLLYKSPGSTTTGTWTIVDTGASSNVNAVTQFLPL